MPTDTTTELARELVGRTGTLVFGNGVNALVQATIRSVGDGFIVARTVEHRETFLEHTHVIPLAGLTYFRTTTSEDYPGP